MKKLTFILLAVAGSMAFVGCSGDDDKGTIIDCAELVNKIADASEDYMSDSSIENCNKLKAAYQAAIDAECPGSSIYQSQIDEMDCN